MPRSASAESRAQRPDRLLVGIPGGGRRPGLVLLLADPPGPAARNGVAAVVGLAATSYLTTGDEPLANIRRIADFVDIIYGFGSYLALLFASAQEAGIELPGLRAVVFSSDAMPVPARRRITGRYGVPVLAHYGSIEVLKIAFDCGTGAGLHLNEDICPMRIVDRNGPRFRRAKPERSSCQIW